MAAKIIDGKAIAEEIYSELAGEVQALRARNIVPKLVVILVGDDPASKVYIRMKAKACARMGLDSETIELPHAATQAELLGVVEACNRDAQVHGILVQMPLPAGLDANEIIEAIQPDKDVDGFHPVNKGRLQAGMPCHVPCTPLGIKELLNRSDYSPTGKNVVILGRSQIVGMPLAILLSQKADGANATVTICHSRTESLEFYIKNADIVIAAMGQPEFLTGRMLSPKAVVVDVGVNRVDDPDSEKGYRLVGDVNFAEARKVVQALTPVPGGVGPLTIAMLIHNTIQAAKHLSG